MTRANRFPPLARPEPERGGNALGVFMIMMAVFAAGFCVGGGAGMTPVEIADAASLLAALPDEWFDRTRIAAILAAEDESLAATRRGGHKFRVQFRERFRAAMRAVSELDNGETK